MKLPELKNTTRIIWSREKLQSGSPTFFLNYGRSMRPLIREGDLVNVIPTNYEQLRVGDIILARTARSNNHLLMHRLIRKFQRNGRPALVTQGDAAWYPDPPMAPDDILGKVLAVKRDKKLICLDRGWRRKLGWILGHLAFLIGWFNKNRVRKYVKFFLKFIPN